jgi:TetR/AcrR family fatty acid metabolism transcriptional regulator
VDFSGGRLAPSCSPRYSLGGGLDGRIPPEPPSRATAQIDRKRAFRYMTDQSVIPKTIMARIVDKEAKRGRLLESAATCFARSGYDATSMEEVAEAAGVSKGSLYDYFDNKEDLFYAVFDWVQRRLGEATVAQFAPGLSASEQILRGVDAGIAGMAEQIGLYPVSLEVWAAAARSGTRGRFADAMRRLYAQYRALFAELMRAGQASGEFATNLNVASLSAVLVGAIDGMLLQYWLDPSFDPRAVAREFLLVFLAGIARHDRDP